MKHLFVAVVMGLGLALAWGAPAEARGPIERACLKADRAAASRSLCNCIQDVADRMLTQREIRRVAKFFADPQQTQDMRQSGRRSDERFWEKYKEYGEAARNYCAPSAS